MLAWNFGQRVGLGAAMATAFSLGCAVQSEPVPAGAGGAGPASTGPGGIGGGAPSTTPILVDVDPNQTMNATPGEGVGVFVEYKTGGHWHVWWTCDTDKTGLDCVFSNTITVATGSISNLVGQMLESSNMATQLNAQKVIVNTDTTTGVDGITFDTPFSSGQKPMITLEAQLNGGDNGQFLFFVQDGQINGGYTGTLTDPLKLEPSIP